MTQSPDTALIVIDVQNDFCPGGALAVDGGDEIVESINAMMGEYAVTVLTQDWHPSNHSSFADNHEGAEPFSLTEMPYGPQVLWPATVSSVRPALISNPTCILTPPI